MDQNKNHNPNEKAPFNEIQGIASTNVPAYSNGSGGSVFRMERNYFHDIFTGIKWQCVEYARRWLLIRKSCIFRDIGTAADMFSGLASIERVTDGRSFSLRACRNGSSRQPQNGSLLIYPKSWGQPFGHVAIITEVVPGFIRIAEQNNKFNYWSGDYARQIPLTLKNGYYYIEDRYEIYGWLEIEDNNHELQPFDDSTMKAIQKQYKRQKSHCSVN